MARQKKLQALSPPTRQPAPWSKEELRAFWKEHHRVRRERHRHSEPVPGQARGATEARSTVENRGAETSLKVGWRDQALDQLVTTLAKNPDTADLSRRLRRFIETARGYEAYSDRDWTGGARKNLMDWTAERLPELDAQKRKRADSSYRSDRITYEYLAGVFSDARSELTQRQVKATPADWLPIIQGAWMTEHHWRVRASQRIGGPVQGQPLTPAQAYRIATTTKGRIRTPKAMAMEMVAALRDAMGLRGPRDVEELRRELGRVRVDPPAL